MTARLVGSVVNVSTQATARPTPPAQETAQNSPGRTLDEVFREFLGEKAAPGAPEARVASLGSGFIIDPSGLIVTNHHVIANAQQVTVTLSDETVLPAQVVGRDPITDLALLKVEPKTPLPAVGWGDSGKAQGRRLGPDDRQSVRARRQRRGRHHLGRGARYPFEPV